MQWSMIPLPGLMKTTGQHGAIRGATPPALVGLARNSNIATALFEDLTRSSSADPLTGAGGRIFHGAIMAKLRFLCCLSKQSV